MDIVSRIWSLALESWCFNWAFIEDVPPVGLALREMLGRGLPGGRNSATGKFEAAGEEDGLESHGQPVPQGGGKKRLPVSCSSPGEPGCGSLSLPRPGWCGQGRTPAAG